MKNMYDMEHRTTQDSNLVLQLQQQFIASNKDDIFNSSVTLALSKDKNSLTEVAMSFKNFLSEGRATMPNGTGYIVVEGKFQDKPVLVIISVIDFKDVHKLIFNVLTTPNELVKIMAFINSTFYDEHLPCIKWWFTGRHGVDSRESYLTIDAPKLLPEYYPDLGDPEKYIEDYLASDESILLIGGPPGTGKTTLIRNMIIRYKMRAHVIYDETLMENDGPFQDFMFNESESRPNYRGQPADDAYIGNDIMVIEDADTILTSRERDGNKLMSRFLNVSDGLIKLPNKKLIFTTNILNFENVDSAIMRPGRCYGVIHTRTMNLTEAQAMAKAAGLPIPIEKREYTLAELFNQGKSTQVRQMGFGVRH